MTGLYQIYQSGLVERRRIFTNEPSAKLVALPCALLWRAVASPGGMVQDSGHTIKVLVIKG
jgi:hypothetical protein